MKTFLPTSRDHETRTRETSSDCLQNSAEFSQHPAGTLASILHNERLLALIALILFVPAPTVGVLSALHAQQGVWGTLLWGAAKVWLFVLPGLWHCFVQKQPFSLSLPRQGGFALAFGVGFMMLAVIWGVFWIWGRDAVSPILIREKVASFGLDNPSVYWSAALYWICINSLLEEYVFRFFLYRQSEILVRGVKWLAVLMAAVFFTVHHSIALSSYVQTQQNVIASLGVFGAGIIWSAMYSRYRSVWIPFISHLLADLGVFTVGAYLIFWS